MRPAHQQMQGAEELWKGQELQPPLILMGASNGAVPGSINAGGRFLGEFGNSPGLALLALASELHDSNKCMGRAG